MSHKKEKIVMPVDNLSDYIHAQCEGSNCVSHSVGQFLGGNREGWKKYPKEWDSPKIKPARTPTVNPYYSKKKK